MKFTHGLWLGVLLAATPMSASAQDSAADSLQTTLQEEPSQPQRPQRPVSMAPT